MHRYSVYEAAPRGVEIALLDASGGCHVAHPSGAVPSIGAELEGPVPGLGFKKLHCLETGRLFRLAFVEINCDRQATVERLHPQVTR